MDCKSRIADGKSVSRRSGRSRAAGFHRSDEAGAGYFIEGEIEVFRETKKDEIVNEKFNRAISGFVDDLSDRTFLFRCLWLFASINIVVWLGVLFFYEAAYEAFSRLFELSNKAGIAVLGVPLFLGFLITYSLCRLKFPDIEENKLQSEMMSSYSYQSGSLKRWYIWLFSICGGIVNVVLLCLANLYLNRGL